MKESIGTFGIDGDQFYLLWGENLQEGHAYFAPTLGEIRKYHQEYAERTLSTGNKWIDILAHDSITPKEYLEVFTTV